MEGPRTFSQTQELVAAAVKARFGTSDDQWLWVRDLTDEWVVFEVETPDAYEMWQIGYTISDDGAVTLAEGDPSKVEAQVEYTQVAESVRTYATGGRVIEAKGSDDAGNRIYRMQIIQVGTSLNGVRYPEAVLTAAAPLYEGAKAFDHHRTLPELNSGSIAGLCGSWRSVEAQADGIYGDFHCLKGATHVTEALDASLAAIEQGQPPLVGVSHDVHLAHIDAVEGGRRIREATEIKGVLSADIVSDPSAGGRVVRMVAGGIEIDAIEPSSQTTEPMEGKAMTLKELLDLLRAAKKEDRAALLTEHGAILEAAGLTADDVPTLIGETPDVPADPDPADPPADPPAAPPAPTDVPAPAAPAAPAPEPALVGAGAPVEQEHAKESLLGRWLIAEAIKAAGLPATATTPITQALPDRITETMVTREAERVKETLAAFGADIPVSSVGGTHIVRVTEESADKARKRLEATFDGDFLNGFTRLSEAYFAITGTNAGAWFNRDVDLAATIIRESWGGPMQGGASRMTEALTSTSWGEVLADVMYKRLMKEYTQPDLAIWRQLVSVAPVLDFKSQKLIRIGGFGTLPTVPEGAPYQALPSFGDEQVTYTPTKKGGIESYTWEMAKSDDMRQLVRIPKALARSAAHTLMRAIFDIFTSNPTMAYDSVALFDAAHGNTGTGALSETTLNTTRSKMRAQGAYGDALNVLGLIQKILLVPRDLEDSANKLTQGRALLPGGTSYASDQPNLHNGMSYVVVDYWTDANDWFTMASPQDAPTIEVGFLDGKQDPELFVQDDPAVGSMFSADIVTWKIRHVYGYAVLDHRPFQRVTN